jgi:hypothetical protein
MEVNRLVYWSQTSNYTSKTLLTIPKKRDIHGNAEEENTHSEDEDSPLNTSMIGSDIEINSSHSPSIIGNNGSCRGNS